MDKDWKWNKKKNIPIFFRFLKDNNAYLQYLANATNPQIGFYLERGIIHGLCVSCLEDYVDTFGWSQSPQGSFFWAELDEKWRKIVDNNEEDNIPWDTNPMYE